MEDKRGVRGHARRHENGVGTKARPRGNEKRRADKKEEVGGGQGDLVPGRTLPGG